MRHIFFNTVAATLLVSCKPATNSDVAALATSAVQGADIALLFSGDGSGGIAKGVQSDLQLMDQQMTRLGFGVEKSVAENAEIMHKKSAQVAEKMLQYPDATMLWFISTHGSPEGQLSMANQSSMSTFNNAAAAMRSARGDRAFRRLIVFIEACFSGQNVDGDMAINKSTGSTMQDYGSGNFNYGLGLAGAFAPPTSGDRFQQLFGVPANDPTSQKTFALGAETYNSNNLSNSYIPNNNRPLAGQQNLNQQQIFGNSQQFMPGLYDELLVIGSSSKSEYSYVSTDGSVAVKAFVNTIQSLSSNPQATINDLISGMKQETAGSEQTLQFRVETRMNGQEPLFIKTPNQPLTNTY